MNRDLFEILHRVARDEGLLRVHNTIEAFLASLSKEQAAEAMEPKPLNQQPIRFDQEAEFVFDQGPYDGETVLSRVAPVILFLASDPESDQPFGIGADQEDADQPEYIKSRLARYRRDDGQTAVIEGRAAVTLPIRYRYAPLPEVAS